MSLDSSPAASPPRLQGMLVSAAALAAVPSAACRLLGQKLPVVLGAQELVRLAGIAEPHPDQPPLAVWILVDRLGAVREGLVDLHDLPRERGIDVRDGLHGL